MNQRFLECCEFIETSIKKSCKCFIDFINLSHTDLNQKNETSECSILHLLCYYNNFNFTKLFFECAEKRGEYINVNITTKHGDSPLYYFFLDSKIFSLNLLKLMISKGANVNQQNNYGSIPLLAFHSTICDITSRNECLEYMLNCGADPNICDKYGFGIIEYFCNRADFPAIDILVKSGRLSFENIQSARQNYNENTTIIKILEKWEEYTLSDIKEPDI